MNFPAPTSGASPESNWLNQIRQAALEREVLSIEGFAKQATGHGFNFKKIYKPNSFAGSPTAANPTMFPFMIYPMKQAINPSHDVFNNLLTFQIRPGLVGVRSTYSRAGVQIGNWWDLSASGKSAGNYETQLFCDGTDDIVSATQLPPIGEDFVKSPPTQNQNGNINIVYGAKTLISNSIDGGNTTGTQIILNIRNDFTFLQAAAFWIEIRNDAGNLDAKMYGQLFDDTVDYPFPDPSPNIIPIGMIVPSLGYPALFASFLLSVGQPLFFPINFYSGHILNRYQPSNSTGFATSPINYRGAWVGDSLDGQSFYPGDIVLIDDNTDSSTVSIAGQDLVLSWNNYMICMQFIDTQSGEPTEDNINWQKFAQKGLSLSYG